MAESKKLKMDDTVVVDQEMAETPSTEWDETEDADYNTEYEHTDQYDSGSGEEQEQEELSIPITEQDKYAKFMEYKYTVQTTPAIIASINQVLEEVGGILQLPSTTCSILLNEFKWDKEKLLEKFTECDQDELFKNAHISDPETKLTSVMSMSSSTTPSDDAAEEEDDEECRICWGDVNPKLLWSLEKCGHRFCFQCWSTYLNRQILDEGCALKIICPEKGCRALVGYANVMSLVQNAPVVMAKYLHLVANDFVSCNRLMCWCPSPLGCTNAIRVEYVDSRPVTCSCGHKFCFKCTQNFHDPLKCELLSRWQKLFADDALTATWLEENTKKCPRCGTSIQKNGGCNIMKCTNRSCGTEFCWACLTDGVTHATPHSCPLWPPADQDKNLGSVQSNRLVIYHKRYLTHKKSSKSEDELEKKIFAKMEEFKTVQGRNLVQVEFLKNAVLKLRECRETLMYTSGFAYFLEVDAETSSNNCILFEKSFQEFENATEGLSWILENEVNMDFEDVVKKIGLKTTNCDRRRSALLGHIFEGYEKGWWTFTNL